MSSYGQANHIIQLLSFPTPCHASRKSPLLLSLEQSTLCQGLAAVWHRKKPGNSSAAAHSRISRILTPRLLLYRLHDDKTSRRAGYIHLVPLAHTHFHFPALPIQPLLPPRQPDSKHTAEKAILPTSLTHSAKAGADPRTHFLLPSGGCSQVTDRLWEPRMEIKEREWKGPTPSSPQLSPSKACRMERWDDGGGGSEVPAPSTQLPACLVAASTPQLPPSHGGGGGGTVGEGTHDDCVHPHLVLSPPQRPLSTTERARSTLRSSSIPG